MRCSVGYKGRKQTALGLPLPFGDGCKLNVLMASQKALYVDSDLNVCMYNKLIEIHVWLLRLAA